MKGKVFAVSVICVGLLLCGLIMSAGSAQLSLKAFNIKVSAGASPTSIISDVEVEISPEYPQPFEEVEVTVSFWISWSGYAVHELIKEDHNFTLVVGAIETNLPVVTHIIHTVSLRRLSEGSYWVNVYVDHFWQGIFRNVTFTVAPSPHPGLIWVPDNCTTIDEAVWAANYGDTIYASSRTYYEHLIINKPVTLIGESKQTTVIDGNGTGTAIEITSPNVYFSGFIIQNADYGVYIHNSGNSTLRDNNIAHNTYNFGVSGDNLSHFVNNIDTSNTVDGKPIYYWINQEDRHVPSDAGYVAIINSIMITVRELNFKTNREGVLLAYSHNSDIAVNFLSNEYGIYLFASNNNTISDSIALNNKYAAYLISSSHNLLYRN